LIQHELPGQCIFECIDLARPFSIDIFLQVFSEKNTRLLFPCCACFSWVCAYVGSLRRSRTWLHLRAPSPRSLAAPGVVAPILTGRRLPSRQFGLKICSTTSHCQATGMLPASARPSFSKNASPTPSETEGSCLGMRQGCTGRPPHWELHRIDYRVPEDISVARDFVAAKQISPCSPRSDSRAPTWALIERINNNGKRQPPPRSALSCAGTGGTRRSGKRPQQSSCCTSRRFGPPSGRFGRTVPARAAVDMAASGNGQSDSPYANGTLELAVFCAAPRVVSLPVARLISLPALNRY